MSRYDRQPAELCDQKSAGMELISGTESHIKRIRMDLFLRGFFSPIDGHLNLLRTRVRIDGLRRRKREPTQKHNRHTQPHVLRPIDLWAQHGHASTRTLPSCQRTTIPLLSVDNHNSEVIKNDPLRSRNCSRMPS